MPTSPLQPIFCCCCFFDNLATLTNYQENNILRLLTAFDCLNRFGLKEKHDDSLLDVPFSKLAARALLGWQ